MNAATITKTLAKLKSDTGPESFGFKRYLALPQHVRAKLHTAHYVETGSTNAHDRIVTFFTGLTEQEYVSWLQFNAGAFTTATA
jgi:hypothetical protein